LENDEKYYPKIRIFVTRNFKFRVEIKENKDARPYQITMGGEAWNSGSGRKYEKIIKEKLNKIILQLSTEAESLLR
jgi:hypothetical protein